MVNLQKSGDSAVKFVFTDSDHYLYGNGEIEVPVNSLLLVIDESEMVTFKKLSGDPFLSFRADNSNLGTKAAIEQFYKDNMVGSTGGGSESGITSGEVQTMIDESISGKADTSDVTAVANDVQTVSGQVATKVNITDFNTYSAATDARIAEDEEVTAAALNNLDENKQGKLVYYSEDTENKSAEILITNDDGEGSTGDNHFNIGGGVAEIGIYNEYDDGQGNVTSNNSFIYADQTMVNLQAGVTENGDTTSTDLSVETTGVTINGDAVATEPYVDAATSGKADTSAVTAVSDALTAHTANTNVHVTSAEKTVWNEKQNSLYIYTENNDLGTAELHSNDSSLIFDAGGVSITANTIMGLNTFNVTSTGVTINGENVLTDGMISTAITSGSTDSEIPTAKATYDAIQAGGGGGATYSAGTNISIDSANTINCTLPISGNNSNIIMTGASNSITADNRFSQVFGTGNTINAYGGYSQYCITVEGINNSCGTFATHVEGGYNQGIAGSYSHVEGAHNELSISTSPYTEVCSHVEGKYNKVLNYSEHASGQYNNSVSVSTTFGDGGNTLFSVGNGTANNARHNAFEIRQNGDIYVNDGTNDVRLQDTILALGGLKLVKLTQSEYDQLATKDANTLYIISNVVS